MATKTANPALIQISLFGARMKRTLKKIAVFFLLDLVFLSGISLLVLLEARGKLKEIELSPFPADDKGRVIAMNHPDAVVEWLLIYRRFFKWKYLVMPGLFWRSLPHTLADARNFYYNRLIGIFQDWLIAVHRDKGKEHSRGTLVGQCQTRLDARINVVLFPEGGRTKTRKPENIIFSKLAHKPMGKASKAAGEIVSGRSVLLGWVDYPSSRFSALPDKGNFSLARFLVWYLKTLFGKNGKICVVWDVSAMFNEPSAEENAVLLEKRLLELADVFREG